MRFFLISFIFLSTVSSPAQHTISGTFTPASDYTWLIAYRLTPGGEAYAADTAIEKGKFSLKIPQNSPVGSYRFVYAVPQEEFYFDVIYNGKEDIQLDFNASVGVQFIQSEENRYFNTYFKEINQLERQLVGLYTEGGNEVAEVEAIFQNIKNTQNSFEKKTEGLLCHNFIKANRPYLYTKYVSVFEYVKTKKQHYFENLDVDDPLLQASGFLTDKLTNYVFTAIPLEKMSPAETEKAMQDNVTVINEQLANVGDTYKFHVFHAVWKQATSNNFNDLADFVFNEHLKKLGTTTETKTIINQIETSNRLRIGARAPEITWKNGNSDKKLSTISGAENYVLVFWSSTCSHCLSELPALHQKLNTIANVKVIAVGLEDDDTIWKKESTKLDSFEHAIALGKWDSEYANTYGIDHTPTYFILDSDKKIIAKPENDLEVVAFLEK